MKLNYKIQGKGQPIILLHGLFGNLDNLSILARAFMDDYQIIQVDLRNHGLSPWSDEMNYSLMADDILQLVDALALNDIILVGHSMGGKVAMRLTECISSSIANLIVLDIAPVSYASDSHTNVFKALNTCIASGITDRNAIQNMMNQYLSVPTTQFLLKSYKNEGWLFNFKAIEQHYEEICGWQEIPSYRQPVLFIRGSKSNYMSDEYQTDILAQFPYATVETVEGANHNVHYEKPQHVINLIRDWITS